MGFPATLRVIVFSKKAFQSLIGFYGFSGPVLIGVCGVIYRCLFQSLIGFYGFSGLKNRSIDDFR